MTQDSPHFRFGAIGVVILSLFAALFARLWFLQVMNQPELERAAESNRIRTVIEQAPRGRIFDRNGKEIVGNRRIVAVTVDWQRYDTLDTAAKNELLSSLAKVLEHDRQRRLLLAAAGVDASGDPATTTTTSTTTTTPGGDGAEPVATPAVPQSPVTVASLRRRLNDPRYSHFKPVPVAEDVTEELEVWLAEHAADFPTVDGEPLVQAERITVRKYLYGSLLAHVLGYVGSVNEDDLKAYQNKLKPYEPDDEIGKAGIERTMERDLRGVPGQIRYEVDARNRPVRVLDERKPVPGNDVYLSVNIDIQARAEQALATELLRRRGRYSKLGGFPAPAGSVVVLDPSNGQVLALASYPTYDPNLFVNGISTENYQKLQDPAAHAPLTDRAISGQYAPGSTFKLFTAYGALALGQITPTSPVADPGSYRIIGCNGNGCVKKNSGGTPHGTISLAKALTVSSDVYFYKIGDETWRRRGEIGDDGLQKTYGLWGLGEKTGIELTGEASGVNPTPAWLKDFSNKVNKGDPEAARANGVWTAGSSVNMAIGQGYVLVTPLQLANGYATFANGGTRYVPGLVSAVTRSNTTEVIRQYQPQQSGKVPLPPDWHDTMLQGFEGVTSQPGGTAATTFRGFPFDQFPVAGKTGTAQVNGKQDTSVFVGFGPGNDPHYVVAAVLEESGFGSDAAAPVVRSILEPIATNTLAPAPLGGSFDATAAARQPGFAEGGSKD